MVDRLDVTTPYFGILVSLIPYTIVQYFYKKTNGFFLLTLLFVMVVAGIVFLKVAGISCDSCKIDGGIINFLLEVTTISFVTPLYKKRRVPRKYWLQILDGIAVGTLVALTLIYPAATLFHLDNQISASMLPQAAAAAITLSVSDGIGGVEELTSLAVILSAVAISALGGRIVKMFKISNLIVRGLTFGISGHILGVAIAKELRGTGESVGGTAITIVGMIIAVIVPPLASLLF